MTTNCPLSPELLAEYESLTAHAGLVDVSNRTQVEITGADRAAFLHGFCTNEIKKLRPGRGCEAFLTNIRGKTLGHGWIYCGADSLVLETVPGQAAAIIAHLDRYVIREDVQLHDRTAAWGELFLSGPQAEEVLRRVGVVQPPAERLCQVAGPVAGCPAAVRRVDWTVTPAFLIQCLTEDGPKISTALCEAGARPCGGSVLDILRIEAGTPEFGRDVTDENLPQEVSRDRLAISFTKGCYLGQETVARLDSLGHVNRRLTGVAFASQQVPTAGLELSAAGQPAGHVTSAAWSPRHGHPLALAHIRRPHLLPGTRLESPLGAAEVVSLPGLVASG